MTPRNTAPIILGSPFLKTTRMKIDVHVGTLSMEFGDGIVKFSLMDAMKCPMVDHSVFYIDGINDLANEVHDSMFEEFLELFDD